MAEEHAGYFICRTDAEAVRECYEQALEFLENELDGEPVDPKGWSLTFATRKDSPVMRVTVLLPPEVEEDGGYGLWIEENPALPNLWAQALDCDVYAFFVDRRTDAEYVEWYSPAGSEEVWRVSAHEEADPESPLPVTYVADVFEVSRDFLLTSLEDGSPPFEQPLDAPLDEARLEKFLRSVGPMPRPPAADGDPNTVVFLPQSVVDEASALAAREGTSLSAVVSQRFTQAFPGLREGLRTENAELARKVAGPANDERVKCQLHIPTSMQEQLRELVQLADRPVSWLLAAAFRLSGS